MERGETGFQARVVNHFLSQVLYQQLSQTVGQRLSTSLRNGHLIP